MSEGETAIKPTFVKRSRPRGSAGVSLGGSSTASTPVRLPDAQVSPEHIDAEDAGVVRRSNVGKKGRGELSHAKDRPERKKSHSYRFDVSQAEELEDAFHIRSSAKASSSRTAPILPTSLDQASLNDLSHTASSAYSTEALAALKASTPSTRVISEMQAAVDEDGNPVMLFEGSEEQNYNAAIGKEPAAGTSRHAFQTMPDPMNHGDSRLRFGAGHLDESAGLVPSQSVIEAAKERRRKAAAGNEIGPADFIPINETAMTTREDSITRQGQGGSASLGPHPDSNLQREEDEVGSGEEEYAEFTGATNRIAVDVKSRKRDEIKRKKEEAEMVIDARHSEDEDDSDDNFEKAQMRKMEMPGDRRQKEHRENSPYRPAPLPPITPLPGMSTTGDRLSARLKDLEESEQAHTSMMEDAQRSLAQLNQDEVANKVEVEVWSEKEGWIRELMTFTESLSSLLEEKFPVLEHVEREFVALLSERAKVIQQTRAKEMEDEMSLFFGVPSVSLLPSRSETTPRDPESSISLKEDEDEEEEGRRDEATPAMDGEATSEIRSLRRETCATPANQGILREGSLSPADLAAFIQARAPLRKREASLMSNVEAIEFQRPDAMTIVKSGGASKAHPSSVHSRFASWREKYPDDYHGAWGGLALASIWEFWARKELCLWDPLCWPSMDGELCQPRDVETAESLNAVQQYIEAGLEGGCDATLGGDDEAMTTLVNTVFVPRLMTLAEAEAYDPWSTSETHRAILLTRQIADVLDRNGVRFQSLLSAFLKPFQTHLHRLDQALSTTPSIGAPGFHPLSIPARLSFATRLLSPASPSPSPIQHSPPSPRGLLFNLLLWNPLLHSPGGGGGGGGGGESHARRTYEALLDLLLSKIGCQLLQSCAEHGGSRLAGQIVDALPPNAPVQADVISRLQIVRNGTKR